MSTRHLEVIECSPLSCRLTRRACAHRHLAARRHLTPHASPTHAYRDAESRKRLDSSPCVRCPIGESNVEHA